MPVIFRPGRTVKACARMPTPPVRPVNSQDAGHGTGPRLRYAGFLSEPAGHWTATPSATEEGSVDELLTATDLDQWSPTLQARAHLPSLIRATVMASVAPDSIRFPAAEGVEAEPGFDAQIEVAGGAPPYVPAGRSVWEIGTGSDIGRKASSDYRKRTARMPATQRAAAAFVFVTSRRWPGKDAWVARRVARGDWAAVRAYDADDLALWLESAPGVRARFSEPPALWPHAADPLGSRLA
jgi:hypothetical protein